MLVCKEKKTDVENFNFQAQEMVSKLGVDSIIEDSRRNLLREPKPKPREGEILGNP